MRSRVVKARQLSNITSYPGLTMVYLNIPPNCWRSVIASEPYIPRALDQSLCIAGNQKTCVAYREKSNKTYDNINIFCSHVQRWCWQNRNIYCLGHHLASSESTARTNHQYSRYCQGTKGSESQYGSNVGMLPPYRH